ncbi:MAG: hypothetical protein EOO82_03260 [Oxalobacteraceae bacterium]|nr:MAG: hypothetical protein EOO82_03260 [Oxalobacteraceae bacterium]
MAFATKVDNAASGGERMRLTEDGNLCIGCTSSITSRLQVKSAGSDSTALNTDFKNSSNTSLLAVRNDGHIGIGNAAPHAALDVVTTSAPDSISGIVHQSSANDAMLSLKNTSTGGQTWFLDSTGNGAGYGGGKFVIGYGDNWNGTNMVMTPNHTMFGYNNEGTSQVAVSSSLSIGTNNTLDALTLNGGSNVGMRLTNNSTGTTNGDGSSLGIDNSGAMMFVNLEAQPIVFRSNGSEVVRFSENGNVGISNTSPAYMLQVAGTIAPTGNGTTIPQLREASHPVTNSRSAPQGEHKAVQAGC